MLRRIRGAVGMGIAWAIAWSLTGVAVGALSVLFPGILDTSLFRVLDAPLPAMGLPGFFGGVFFSIVLGIAGRKQRFRDLSMRKFVAWGALGGLLLALFPLLLVGLGLASPQGDASVLYRAIAVITGPFMLMGAACAAATLAIAKKGEAVAAAAAPEPEPVEMTR